MIRRFTLRHGQTGRKYTSVKLAYGQRERGELHAILLPRRSSLGPDVRCGERNQTAFPTQGSIRGVAPRNYVFVLDLIHCSRV